MAYSALPILFYNLGGEMLYVLDQRLVAQNIEENKASKVISDIVTSMFNSDSFNEMIKPQALYSRTSLKSIFKKIVHSSIMKVNTDSMEKLYDLMLMSFKYQILECNNLRELLHITLNHLDATLIYVESNQTVAEKVKKIYSKLVSMYDSLTVGEYVLLKQALLSFLQDANSKVSVYLSLNKQNDEGKFVIPREGELPEGFDVPGKITLYKSEKNSANVLMQSFDSGCKFFGNSASNIPNVSNDFYGIRCTRLGTNIYKASHKLADCQTNLTNVNSKESSKYAQAELVLLAQMIGSDSDDDNYDFKLSLFSEQRGSLSGQNKASSSKKFSIPKSYSSQQFDHLTLPDEIDRFNNSLSISRRSTQVLSITPSKTGMEEINKVMENLSISNNQKKSTPGEDMLSIMDS